MNMNSRYHVFNVYHEVVDGFNDKVLVIGTRIVENTPWGDAYGESVDFLYKDTPEYSNYFESIKDKDSEYFYANSNDFERKFLHIFRTPETYLVHRSLREVAINQQEQIEPVDLGLSVYWSDYETVGGLFNDAVKGSVELTLTERIWDMILEMVRMIAECFNIEDEEIFDTLLNRSDKLSHFVGLYQLKLAS